MTIKTSARSVLILATGLFVCFAGPLRAAAGAGDNAVADSKAASLESERAAAESIAHKKYARQGSRHWKRYAHRKSDRVAVKPSIAKKADATDVAAGDGGISSAFPSSVANANAQLATAADTPDGNDTLAGNARAMSARANDILQAAADKPADAQPATQPATETQVTSPDQLNDVDRTLPANATPATASVDAPAAPVTASSGESSWDQASLIGKIFIGLGALLTMASAARMFMM